MAAEPYGVEYLIIRCAVPGEPLTPVLTAQLAAIWHTSGTAVAPSEGMHLVMHVVAGEANWAL